MRITVIMAAYKMALITGGSSGIGLAIAKALVKKGASVCLLARDHEKLEKAQQDLIELADIKTQSIEILSCDVSDFSDVSLTLEQWTKKAGVPDLVINSAGVTYPGYFQELDVDIFHWLMDINYYGTVHVLKFLIPLMIERGSGTVVNISSQAGFAGVFGYSAYGASKYAVRGLTDVLRAEMKPMGIKVAIVFPPDTQTPQLEFEKSLKPEETQAIASSSSVLSADEVADSILNGLKKGRYVIIPGLEGKVLYRIINLLGNLIYPVMDWLVRKAQKNI